MTTALALVEPRGGGLLPTATELQTMLSLADTLVKSGLLPNHVRSPQAALAIIQKGKELALPPMYALTNIVMVQGKPTASAELMLAVIYRDHGDDAIRFKEATAERATVEYKRRNWKQAETFSFTIQDADRAGLTKKDGDSAWRKYPQSMLRARCISAVARMAFPDSISGCYTAEELGAEVEVDPEGTVSVVPPPTAALPAAQPAPQTPTWVIDASTPQGNGWACQVYSPEHAKHCTRQTVPLTATRKALQNAGADEGLVLCRKHAEELAVLSPDQWPAVINQAEADADDGEYRELFDDEPPADEPSPAF